MVPTFRIGQLLYVRPEMRNLAPGDVVVYFNPSRGEHVVHRVISVTSAGLTTRGDHNLRRDELQVTYGQIVGRVDAADDGGVIKNVIGGWRGLWNARMRWSFLLMREWIRRILIVPYESLRSTRIVPSLWRPKIKKIQIKNGQDELVKYLYKQQTVAVWDPARRHFDCRKPFDLVIPHPKESK